MKSIISLAGMALCASALAAGEVSVRAAKPELVGESDAVSLVGRVKGSHTVSISARVVGNLWENNGKEGDIVKKGDVLFRIEDTVYKANLQSALAKEAELLAQLKIAEVEADRYSKGETSGGVSKVERDRAILRRDVAKAELDAAKAQVTLCRNDLDYCTIATPIAGRIGRGKVDAGNNVGPDTGTLREVIAFDPIDVEVAIPEPRLLWAFDHCQLKSTMHMRLIRSDGSECPIPLKVEALDNKVDSATGTVIVRFRGPNPEGKVIPGGYVKLLLSEVFDAPKLAIPMSAVIFEGEKRFVYVLKDGKAAKREVRLGPSIGDRMFVLEGLAQDDSFAVAGIHKLSDGAPVRVKEN